MTKTPKTLARKTIDPFRIKQTHNTSARTPPDVVTPPEAVASAVDAFRAAADQAKHIEGEATVYKNLVFEFGKGEYAKRAMHGKTASFKILGKEEVVMFISADKGSGLTEEDVATLAAELGPDGEAKAASLVTKDYSSIRFNPDVLEKHYEAVVEALQTLPPEVLENLFLPGAMVAVKGAGEMLRAHAKDAAHYERLLDLAKITLYIKGG